jgi:predicted dehydrogenase
MKPSKEKLRLAIIGSGAIAEKGYLPGAELVPSLAVTHVVDLDSERAKDVATRFQVPNSVTNYQEVFEEVEAVVVATPPSSHASISIDCLNHGLHVLCEKPLATSVEEAKEVVAASKRTQAHLAVGMVRRVHWSSQLLKKLIETGVLGDIHRFDVEEGWEFSWPLRTGHIFQDYNSGGVISDTGPHLIDLLLWITGSQSAEIIGCWDDNWGGVAANAVVEIAIETSSRRAEGKIELSFTRRLRNTLRLYGDTGCLEAPTVGGDELLFYPGNEHAEPMVLKPQNAIPRKWHEQFTTQLANFADSIIDGTKRYVSADEALTTMTLIRQCHSLRKPTAQPWEIVHLESFFANRKNG